MNDKLQSFLIFFALIFFSTTFLFKFVGNTFISFRAFSFMPYFMFFFAVAVLLFRNSNIDHNLIEVFNVENVDKLEEC